MPQRFTRGTIVAVAVVAGLVLSACSGPGGATTTQIATQTAPPAPIGGAPNQAATATAAGLTVGVTEGPYYVTGTAELKDGKLNATNLPGEPMKISGYVYSGPGTGTPIPGAKVEIWHADSDGVYHPNANGPASQYKASELALRGFVLADKGGRYEFTSIYPGYYQGRTRHIHVRASADAVGGVTTQIIVPPKTGDGTTPATDMIAQSLPASYQVQFADNNGVLETTFDFHLGAD